MLGEIDRDFYCSDVLCKEGLSRECLGTKPETPEDDYLLPCPNCHRKYPTPEQFKLEYGKEYPKDWTVYLNGWFSNGKSIYIGGVWQNTDLEKAKDLVARMEDYENSYKMVIVCSCTPWGKPPDEWRPE